jgi:hypothetical protein
MKEYKFDSYRLFYLSGYTDYAAKITCYNGNKRIAMIFFMDKKKPLPENNFTDDPMNIYYSLNDFQNILAIVENEKPLSIYTYENGKTCEIGSRVFTT